MTANPLKFDYDGLHLVISGGQTGADQAGLAAAYDVGISTGGYAPFGFRTLAGDNPKLLHDLYGLEQTEARNYQVRTEMNVMRADGTIRLASNFESPGEILTLRCIKKHKKPWLDIPLLKKDASYQGVIEEWLIENQVSTLNVAGNGDKIPSNGFGDHYHAAYFILLAAFSNIKNIKKVMEETQQ